MGILEARLRVKGVERISGIEGWGKSEGKGFHGKTGAYNAWLRWGEAGKVLGWGTG